jgi:hypothetical protein
MYISSGKKNYQEVTNRNEKLMPVCAFLSLGKVR